MLHQKKTVGLWPRFRAEVWAWLHTLIGMAGIRLDRIGRSRYWKYVLGLWLCSVAINELFFKLKFFGSDVQRSAFSVHYSVILWFLYYAGISFVLGTQRVRQGLLRRFGEEKAHDIFDAALVVVKRIEITTVPLE